MRFLRRGERVPLWSPDLVLRGQWSRPDRQAASIVRDLGILRTVWDARAVSSCLDGRAAASAAFSAFDNFSHYARRLGKPLDESLGTADVGKRRDLGLDLAAVPGRALARKITSSKRFELRIQSLDTRVRRLPAMDVRVVLRTHV